MYIWCKVLFTFHSEPSSTDDALDWRLQETEGGWRDGDESLVWTRSKWEEAEGELPASDTDTVFMFKCSQLYPPPPFTRILVLSPASVQLNRVFWLNSTSLCRWTSVTPSRRQRQQKTWRNPWRNLWQRTGKSDECSIQVVMLVQKGSTISSRQSHEQERDGEKTSKGQVNDK